MVGLCLAGIVDTVGYFQCVEAVEGGLVSFMGAVIGAFFLASGEVINILNAFF